jgi:low temperature requirement protein LtrA
MGMLDAAFDSDLRDDLRHRLRPMTGRNPRQRDRSASPLELLYDLTYVIAFAGAAEQLAHQIEAGHWAAALGAYLFAVFAVTWAWLNFTWFTSAYGNDDVLFRLATIVQMAGVIILTFGLPDSFDSAVDGRNPNNALMVVGYVVMRVPLIALWLRAAHEDHEHRATARAYAAAIAAAQLAWILTATVELPIAVNVCALLAVAGAELAAPVVIEARLGKLPWNAGHIAERFNLLTLITIGEVVAATTAAVDAVVREQGWTAAAVLVIASGLALAAAMWWAYFLIPSRSVLSRLPERTMLWRYAHLPIFGAIAAVGAGLRVTAAAAQERSASLLEIALCLAVPLACVLVTIFLTWSALTGSHDLTHIPLFVATLVPLSAAVAFAASASSGPIDLRHGPTVSRLVVVLALIAAGAVIEVVGHELVGYRHTVQALRNDAPL